MRTMTRRIARRVALIGFLALGTAAVPTSAGPACPGGSLASCRLSCDVAYSRCRGLCGGQTSCIFACQDQRFRCISLCGVFCP